MGVFSYVGLGVLLAKGNRAVEHGVAKGAQDLERRAEEYAPVNTGTLSGGIQAQVSGKTAIVSTTAETNPGQALYEEIGSVHNPANEYMQRAVLDTGSDLVEHVAAQARAEF